MIVMPLFEVPYMMIYTSYLGLGFWIPPKTPPQTGIGGFKRKVRKPDFLCVRISKNVQLFGVQKGCTFSIYRVIFDHFGGLGGVTLRVTFGVGGFG